LKAYYRKKRVFFLKFDISVVLNGGCEHEAWERSYELRRLGVQRSCIKEDFVSLMYMYSSVRLCAEPVIDKVAWAIPVGVFKAGVK
jgi:hypothetical protein